MKRALEWVTPRPVLLLLLTLLPSAGIFSKASLEAHLSQEAFLA